MFPTNVLTEFQFSSLKQAFFPNNNKDSKSSLKTSLLEFILQLWRNSLISTTERDQLKIIIFSSCESSRDTEGSNQEKINTFMRENEESLFSSFLVYLFTNDTEDFLHSVRVLLDEFSQFKPDRKTPKDLWPLFTLPLSEFNEEDISIPRPIFEGSIKRHSQTTNKHKTQELYPPWVTEPLTQHHLFGFDQIVSEQPTKKNKKKISKKLNETNDTASPPILIVDDILSDKTEKNEKHQRIDKSHKKPKISKSEIEITLKDTHPMGETKKTRALYQLLREREQNEHECKNTPLTSYISSTLSFSWSWTGVGRTVLCMQTKNVRFSPLIAAFDLEGTLITITQRWKTLQGTTTTATLSSNESKTDSSNSQTDVLGIWKFSFPQVIEVINYLYHSKGYKIVVMTSSMALGKNKIPLDKYRERIEQIFYKIGVEIVFFCATKEDLYQKPSIGLWTFMQTQFNSNIAPDLEKSFYVGDAAGRPYHHSNSDRQFAANLKLPFYIPQQFFTHFWDEKRDIEKE